MQDGPWDLFFSFHSWLFPVTPAATHPGENRTLLNPTCHNQTHPAQPVILQWKDFPIESTINKTAVALNSINSHTHTPLCLTNTEPYSRIPIIKQMGNINPFLIQSLVPQGQNMFHIDAFYTDGFIFEE